LIQRSQYKIFFSEYVVASSNKGRRVNF